MTNKGSVWTLFIDSMRHYDEASVKTTVEGGGSRDTIHEFFFSFSFLLMGILATDKGFLPCLLPGEPTRNS